MAENNNEFTIFERIQNLKDLFKFGGEIVPFLEELFSFLKDVLPLMDRVSASLQETTAHMPKAQNRIAEASQTAEAATQQIMDKLEHINNSLANLSAQMGESNGNANMKTIVEDIQNDSFEIIYSLQFQDITAQQLGHAQQILQAINERFQKLFDAIKSMNIDENLKRQFFGRLSEDIAAPEKDSIDEISQDKIRNSGISQSDIDKLFEKM